MCFAPAFAVLIRSFHGYDHMGTFSFLFIATCHCRSSRSPLEFKKHTHDFRNIVKQAFVAIFQRPHSRQTAG